MKYRIIRFILAFVSILVLIVFITIYAMGAFFIDIPLNQPSIKDAINFVSDNGYMNGQGDGNFYPNASVTRAVAVIVLSNLSQNNNNYICTFSDVAEDSYYYNALGWAQANGIASGDLNGNFYPDNYITKEQFIVLLHNFAVVFGRNSDFDETINQACDYYSVSSYAVNSLNWAYSYGILERNSLSDSVNPSEQITRGELAKIITNYWSHIECFSAGINYYAIENDISVFSSVQEYGLSNDDYNRLINLATVNGYSDDYINHYLNVQWKGSCFGMALSCILDNIGKVDINGNYCSGCDSLFSIDPILKDIASPLHKITADYRNETKLITEVESKINMYQLSARFMSSNYWLIPTNGGVENGASRMHEGQKHSGLGLVSILVDELGGHTVVVYGKPQLDGNTYTYNTYDPNNPDISSSKIVVNNLQGGITANYYDGIHPARNISVLLYDNDFSCFDALDIDGDYNVDESMFGYFELDDYILVNVESGSGLTINNNQGEEIFVSNEGVSGDMDGVLWNMIVYGNDVPATFSVLIPNSDSFNFEITENEGDSSIWVDDGNGIIEIQEESFIDNSVSLINNGNNAYSIEE